MKKVAVITGASSGIGLETALGLIKKGWTVYGAARRVERMQALVDAGGNALSLDLTDEKSIEKFALDLMEREEKIDLLVNNAGFGLGGSFEEVPVDEGRRQFEVNVFGLVSLTQKLLPVMRRTGSGKIINISSMAGRFSSPFTGWYHATKYSVEALTDALRMEVKPSGIKVVLVEPGLIQTDWGKIHGQNIRKFSGSGDYKKYADSAADFYEENYCGKKSGTKPEVISNLIIKISEKNRVRARYHAGKLSGPFLLCKKLLPDSVFEYFESKLIMKY